MKVIMVLYLAFYTGGFDGSDYVMAAVPKKAFESVEQCHTESTRLRDTLPDFVIGAHCLETEWTEHPQFPLSDFEIIQNTSLRPQPTGAEPGLLSQEL